MLSQQQSSPFTYLCALEQSILSHAKGLPFQETVEDIWVGVSFLTGNQVLLMPLEEIVEIMRVPSLPPVPGVKNWLRGMATCRGELFPVTDLYGFLTLQISTVTNSSRVLFVSANEEFSGILVDKVFGLQRISSRYSVKDSENISCEIAPFVIGKFVSEQGELPIISCKKIMQHPRFRDVALREDEILEFGD